MTKKELIPGEALVALAPVNLTIGTACPNFSTCYSLSANRGKEHLRVRPNDFRVHLRCFVNGMEVAITDDPKRVFVASTQFWSEMDIYSIYNKEMDVTISAPHGFNLNVEDLMPAVQKLQKARELIDSAQEETQYEPISDDDGLHVLITVVSKKYSSACTLFENPEDSSVTFASAYDRIHLGKAFGNGFQRDDFAFNFRQLMDLHHMWIYLRVLLGYDYPYVTIFDIGDSNITWTGIPEENSVPNAS